MRSHAYALRYMGICLLAIFIVAAPAQAALVRGQLSHVEPSGKQHPLQGVSVTLYSRTFGRSVEVKTDAAGMYYFNVPAGAYWLEVWISKPPRVYQITVIEPRTDIPPVSP